MTYRIPILVCLYIESTSITCRSKGKREINLVYLGGNCKKTSGLNLLELTEVIHSEVGNMREKNQTGSGSILNINGPWCFFTPPSH